MTNKKYLDSQNKSDSGYLDRINDLIKKSQIVKGHSMIRLSAPDELD